MSVIVNESGEIVQVVVKEIYGKDGQPGADGQDYQVDDFADFTGELDVSGDFQPYNDYTGAEITSLTLSTTKKRGATGNVRIKGGSIATNALTNLGTVLPKGAVISTDVNQWNEIDYQYLSDTHIRIILTVLDSNFQPVDVNQPAPSNTAPVTSADSYSVDENQVLNVAAPGVLANDTDADADSLTAILVSDVTNGALTLNPDGSFTYTPNTDYFGSDSFTYKSNDGTVDGNTVTVSITVNEEVAANTAPTDITLSANTVNEDAANDTVIGTLTTTDTEGGAMTYSIVSQQVAGAFKVVGDQLQVADTNQIVYANNTTLTVTIRTTDSGGLTYDEQFTINVNEAVAAGTYILEDVPNSAAGYSLNKKRDPNYTGPAFRIRRSSDDAEQDIPYSGDITDETAFTNFMGSDNAFLVKVYSHSGSTDDRDLKQLTPSKQPQIGTAGVINKNSDGEIVARFSAGQYLLADNFGVGSERSTYIKVARKGAPVNYHNIYIHALAYTSGSDFQQVYSASGSDKITFAASNNAELGFVESGTSFTLDTPLIIGVNKSSTGIKYRINGTEVASKTGTQTLEEQFIIGGFNDRFANMEWSEALVWNADKNSSASAIEAALS